MALPPNCSFIAFGTDFLFKNRLPKNNVLSFC